MDEEPKDIIVLGTIKSGVKSFDKICQIAKIEPSEINSILEKLESRGLIEAKEKSGLFGKKIEITATEKGAKELEHRIHELEGKWEQMTQLYKAWTHLYKAMKDSSWTKNPFMVLLTDGPAGAAYFEHMYLSKMMKIPIVEAGDIYVTDSGHVAAKMPGEGEVQIDVIYRRVEDLDIFVPGLTKAYIDGKIALVNSPGTGVADDKLVYSYVPKLIRHYLSEEPILEQPKSYNPTVPEELEIAIQNVENLVVKERGGYGGMEQSSRVTIQNPKEER